MEKELAALHDIAMSTIGNLIGGSLISGAVYWFVCIRRRPGR
jgi:formate transporter